MFQNVSAKIKACAVLMFIVGAVCAGLVLFKSFIFLGIPAILSAGLILVASFITSLMMYGFAQIMDNVAEIKYHTYRIEKANGKTTTEQEEQDEE